MISLTGIERVFRVGDEEVHALRGVSLDIEQGEFLSIMGPSGSGKSTLMHLLGGLDRPTAGEVVLAGERLSRLSDDALTLLRRRKVGFIFQSFNLLPTLTAEENVALPLLADGQPLTRHQQRLRDLLELVRLGDRRGYRPDQLSGGQQQRVALGRALVRSPKAFLMDEPLSNLDAKLRVQTRAEISKLHQRLQTTFIYVTHDQVEAMTMASRIAVMNKGILQQLDSPQNLYDRPNNLFVAGFIGSPAMNFFPSRIRKGDGKLFVESDGFRVEIPAEKIKTYQGLVDKEVIFGIRPEDIHNPLFAPPGISAAPVEAQVDVTELMGNEIFLYLVTGKNSYVARVDPRSRYSIGDKVELAFNMENFHIFDPSEDKENPVAVR